MSPELEPSASLPWLVRLRWLFLAGQLISLPVAVRIFHVALAWIPLIAAIAIFALSNLALHLVRPTGWATSRGMGAVFILDTILLTVLLAAAGGANNPFTVFYLVHITLSAVVLSPRWISAVAALAVAGFGLLFLVPSDPHAMHRNMSRHLQGMWAAFVIAAALIAFFVRRITTAIAAQRAQIAALQEVSDRNARLASLTTLAAGAAHELNSPLGTIAVAAHEAELRLARGGDPGAAIDDLRLIQLEVDRCQGILHQMSARACEVAVAEPLTLAALAARVRDELAEALAGRVELRVAAPDVELSVPPALTVQSIGALVKNALDASAGGEPVVIEMVRSERGVRIAVVDRGTGIVPEVLAKVGEPFFTTKQPGAGLGLGVFLARAFFESRGGRLAIESTAGVGTRAVVELPLAAAA